MFTTGLFGRAALYSNGTMQTMATVFDGQKTLATITDIPVENSSCTTQYTLPVPPFTKGDYTLTLERRRAEFVIKHFEERCNELFVTLERMATSGKVCNVEAMFEVPEFFDPCKTKDVLKHYFEDLGYDVIVERKVEYPSQGEKTIVLTLK